MANELYEYKITEGGVEVEDVTLSPANIVSFSETQSSFNIQVSGDLFYGESVSFYDGVEGRGITFAQDETLHAAIIDAFVDNGAPLFAGSGYAPVLQTGTFSLTEVASGFDSSGQYPSPENIPAELVVTEINLDCFCSGTRILTARGEVPVEKLCAGEMIVTKSGEFKPIVWVGSWTIDPSCAFKPEQVLPVCVRAHALGENVPHRDLYLSPNHSLFIDGFLIPAQLLINGTTIYQVHGVGSLEYYHVELDLHDVMLAEGAPTETFLNTKKSMFIRAGAEPKSWEDACAPILLTGDKLELIKQSIAARARRTDGITLAA